MLEQPARRRSSIGEQDIYLSASIGIAMIPAGATPEEVIRDADAAMYRAKSEGRGRHALFDSDAARGGDDAPGRGDAAAPRARARARSTAPASAIAYQPIAHAADGRLHGFEALARWRDADGRTS